jgi:hypothetical protein
MRASNWSLSSIHLVVVLGERPLGRCPSTYAAHANKIVSEPYKKEQYSNMQCQRLKQDESMKHQCDRNLHISTEMSGGLNHKKFLHSILRLLARILMIRSQGHPGQAEN